MHIYLYCNHLKTILLQRNMSAYKVAEFVDGIQLVPINWLTSDFKFSYWPPSTLNPIKVNKLIASRSEPDINWNKYSVLRIFCSSGIVIITNKN